jgi:hypothetical protein
MIKWWKQWVFWIMGGCVAINMINFFIVKYITGKNEIFYVIIMFLCLISMIFNLKNKEN